jgi:hypothetical protein
MKARNKIYWIATLIFSVFMATTAYQYLAHNPRMMAAFSSLGYPPYFPTILAIAKLLGVLAILVPGAGRLKEWAYAGFTFTLIGAFLSHMASGQTKEAIMPVVALAIMAVSDVLRPQSRKIAELDIAVVRLTQ